MDSPTESNPEPAAGQPEPSPQINDPYGYYKKAEESRAKKKELEAGEEQGTNTYTPPTAHHLHSPIIFSDQQYYRLNENTESAHGLPVYRQSMPPPPPQNPFISRVRESNSQSQPEKSRPRSTENAFGSRSQPQLPLRNMNNPYGSPSQEYGAPSQRPTASQSPTYNYPLHARPTWNSGAHREQHAPSPDMSMDSGTLEESYDGIGGMEDESGGEIEEYESMEDRNGYEIHARSSVHNQEEQYRARTPLHNGSSLFASRQPVQHSSMPHTSRSRRRFYQPHSGNEVDTYPDGSEYLEGTPNSTHSTTKPPGRPLNGTINSDDFMSQTPDFERKSRIDGFESPRYPPWRNIGQGRRESRFSGAVEPRSCNNMPRAVARSGVSDAVLMKKGLPVTKAKNVINRAYGANDPENIAIVNMHDHENLSWREIADRMNAKRVTKGKIEQLSITAIANRYSRCAPVLMGAAGMNFVPLARRRKMAKGEMDFPKIDWTAENDVRLVEIFKAYEAARWETVCREFQEETGIEVHPMEVARRYAAIR